MRQVWYKVKFDVESKIAQRQRHSPFVNTTGIDPDPTSFSYDRIGVSLRNHPLELTKIIYGSVTRLVSKKTVSLMWKRNMEHCIRELTILHHKKNKIKRGKTFEIKYVLLKKVFLIYCCLKRHYDFSQSFTK